ncbi:MAG TPA: hypothetical protein ENN09_01325 [Planctomycetes bacterium]|nr:hypothetical protein [Planctomycetota bacterium]
MFVGCYRHKLNSKGQAALPAKLRTVIPPDAEGNRSIYLMKLAETPIYGLTSPVLEELAGRLSDELKSDRRRRHEFYGRVEVVDIDPQGRIVIPSWMREMAGIEQEVVFVGAGSRIEIWPAAAWDAYAAETRQAVRTELDGSVSKNLDAI